MLKINISTIENWRKMTVNTQNDILVNLCQRRALFQDDNVNRTVITSMFALSGLSCYSFHKAEDIVPSPTSATCLTSDTLNIAKHFFNLGFAFDITWEMHLLCS